jgi:AraC-like DNA-binding protein
VHRQEFQSDVPDEAHGWLRRVYAEHQVKIAGSTADFAFSADLISLDGMTFGAIAHSMAVEVDSVDGLRDLSIIEHQEGESLRLRFGRDSVDLRPSDCFLVLPDRPLSVAWRSIGVGVTTLSLEELQRDAVGQIDHVKLEIDFSRPITPAAGRHWSQTVRYVRNAISNSPMLASAPLARRELGWLVNSAALACFPNSTLDAGSISYTGDTPQPLRRALAFIDEHAGDPITLDEIAAAARLSPRGVQAAFRRHLDTTPLSYLRGVRMERAHRDLQGAEPGDGVSVAALAAKWGFTHLGRFAVDYRRRYGTYPSQTLRG